MLLTNDKKIKNDTTNTALRLGVIFLPHIIIAITKEIIATAISKTINEDKIIMHAEAAHIAADNNSLLFEVFIPENIVAKYRETKSTIKFSKKYISMYKVFTTVTVPHLIVYILALDMRKSCHNLVDGKIF